MDAILNATVHASRRQDSDVTGPRLGRQHNSETARLDFLSRRALALRRPARQAVAKCLVLRAAAADGEEAALDAAVQGAPEGVRAWRVAGPAGEDFLARRRR